MTSSIEWLANRDGSQGKTWNPTEGCDPVSPGCLNCYAAAVASREMCGAHEGLTRRVKRRNRNGRLVSLPVFNGRVPLHPERLALPLRWRKPQRVFVDSMSDLFHELVPFEFIAAVFGVMAACRQHTFLVLTKRIARALEFFAWAEAQGAKHDLCRNGMPDALVPCAWAACCLDEDVDPDELHQVPERWEDDFVMPTTEVFGTAWPLPNVHLGVSAEDQARWDERVPLLLQCPASVRWVSVEPLLGPIDMSAVLLPKRYHPDDEINAEVAADHAEAKAYDASVGLREGWHRGWGPLHWVVPGGESGPGARPTDVAWIRSIVAQCRAAGLPVFVKQLGRLPMTRRPEDGEHPHAPDLEWPVGTYFTTAPGHLGTQWHGRWVRLSDKKGKNMAEWPEDLRIREYPHAQGT